MAINPYISSANIFVYPCANRKEGFWESKLATEYSLRTLIPWKITKPSFVITGDAAASNLEFVINGYYFNIKTNWRTAINPTSGQPLWAHIRLANKPLTSTAEGETTTILVNYEDGGQILDEGTFPNCTFKGVRFDSSAGTEATNYYHLQILDEAGNFLHRDMIKINCDNPLEQDDETGLLSLKYRSPLKVDSEELTLDYDSTLTLSSNKLSVTNPANTYIQPVTSGTHTSAGTLTYLKVGNNYYTIPQGKTYTASNQGITLDNTTFKLLTADGLAVGEGDTGTNKYLRIALADSSGLNFDNGTPGKLSIKLADNSGLDKTDGLKINLNSTCGLTVDANNFLALKLASDSGLDKNSGLSLNLASKSGLDKSNGLKIKVNATSGLELTSDGLKMKYPLPSIDGNAKKILAVTSDGTSLEWVEKPSGGGGSGTVTSIGITGNDGISVSNSPITSSGNITLGLKLGSTLQYSNNYLNVKCKSSGGLAIDNNNGLYISENSWNATCNTETFYLYAQSTDYIARATVKALTLGKYCTLHITKVELTSQTTSSTTFSISSMTASDSDVRDRFLANTFYNSTVTFYGKNNHSIKLYVDDGINPHFLQLQFSPNITSDDWTDIKYVPITYILKN